MSVGTALPLVTEGGSKTTDVATILGLAGGTGYGEGRLEEIGTGGGSLGMLGQR